MKKYFRTKKGVFVYAEENTKLCKQFIESSLYQEVDIPFITVSVPVYKSKGLLKRAVKYILRQTYPHFELIVVSDADPDKSIKEIRQIEDSRLKIIELEENIGRYAVDHLVVTELANGTHWVPVDSDDWCAENYLSSLVNILRSKPESDVVFAAQYIQENYRKRKQRVRNWDGTDTLIWHAHMSALWRRDFVVEMNLTNPNFRIGWDSIVTSVPWIVGNVEYTQSAFYHRVKRHNSLTSNKETCFGSEHRNRVKMYITQLWKEIVKNKNDVQKIKQILNRSRYEQY